MELHALGLNYSHDGSFDIRRPNGSGDNLLLIFKSSAVVRLHGREYSVSPDSAILYKKGTEQIYRACKGFYINHWLHFDCDDTLTRDYSLPYRPAISTHSWSAFAEGVQSPHAPAEKA